MTSTRDGERSHMAADTACAKSVVGKANADSIVKFCTNRFVSVLENEYGRRKLWCWQCCGGTTR